MIEGNGNPNAKNYNSLADYTWTKDGIIELRIPWLLLQAKDPSRKEFIGDIYTDGDQASVTLKNIGVGVIVLDKAGEVVTSMSTMEQQVLPTLKTFEWDSWDLPSATERLKRSYYIIQKLYARY